MDNLRNRSVCSPYASEKYYREEDGEERGVYIGYKVGFRERVICKHGLGIVDQPSILSSQIHHWWKKPTLAKKLDAVHRDTVNNSSIIPRVRRARPPSDFSDKGFECKLLLKGLVEEVGIRDSCSRSIFDLEVDRKTSSATVGGNEAILALILRIYEAFQG